MSTVKKSTKKSTTTAQAAAPSQSEAPAAAPAPSKKASKAQAAASAPATEPAVSVPKVKSSSSKKSRVRRSVSRDTLESDFDELLKRVDDEITKLKEAKQSRQSSEKVKGVKFLRSLNKMVKILKTDTLRVMKIKPKTNRVRPTSSGFMKPVNISSEMASFAGLSPTQKYSRVDITKFICNYIKEHNLQNKEDKRQIVCDQKLSSLLKYDPNNVPTDKKTGKPAPLTYFRLQQYIQPHFVSTEA